MSNWKFDSRIEQIYENHVSSHIPNYERVIQKCMDLCITICEKNDPIIDVGCANGITLRKLKSLGFNNLYGVDSSSSMVKHIDPSLAKIIISDTFPENTYKIILANWVVHFIKDKKEYLTSIYRNLDQTGVLILSEKTSLDPTLINFYHLFKKRAGVTDLEILEKSKSLKNVMHINSIDWYQETLKDIGFKKIEIIDADWCFTTFYITK